MFGWLSLTTRADLDRLSDHIAEEFAPDLVAQKLQDGFSDDVKAVLIEQPYIDKDYRSTYYNFYAMKGLNYRADCVRLHFFDQWVTFDPATLQLNVDPGAGSVTALTDHYFGYMVLRPTNTTTIGRSVVSPHVRLGAAGRMIASDHKVHVLGYKLTVRGFPWMEQHIDISRCAHAACWAILRHYSERFSNYREYSIHDVTMMAQPFNPGGLIPSLGLKVPQAERVFQEAGTFPVRITRLNRCDISFYRQLAACLDSGFPLFAALNSLQHAVTIVGFDWRTRPNPAVIGLRHSWDEMDSLTLIDDNHLPYISIPTADAGIPYCTGDIDEFIVPFPEKLFYPPQAVERLVPILLAFDKFLGLPKQEECVVRYFVTTGAALRYFVREQYSGLDPKLLHAVMELPLTQFVWIVEFSTSDQWQTRRVTARAIIDGTASFTERLPLWLFHTTKKALIFNREKIGIKLADMFREVDLPGSTSGALSRMEKNLHQIRN